MLMLPENLLITKPLTTNRLPLTDHRHNDRLSTANEPPNTNSPTSPLPMQRPRTRQLTDRSSTIPPTTDSLTGYTPTHRLNNRSSTNPLIHQQVISTNPPTHQVNWPPTIWLNRTYFNRGWLVVVGGLSVVGSFVIPWKFQETLKSSISFNLKHIVIIITSLTFLLQVV